MDSSFNFRSVETINWNRCTDDCYPEDEDNIVILISYYSESDNRWYCWIKSECPYGWNVLCRSTAYWIKINLPYIAF